MKQFLFSRRNENQHWVGDGFLVRNIFSYNDTAKALSPFLLLDYAGPMDFLPNVKGPRRGVGAHPHRGFETVTIVFSGEVEHRDSSGGGGVIGPGDIQWMTAASGIVHEELHGKTFSKTGGCFEMIQLWVNLPAKDKMTQPRYQSIHAKDIPHFNLPDGAGFIRVISGEFAATKGPAETFTPIELWDLRVNRRHVANLKMPSGYTTLLFVLEGEILLASGEKIETAELAVLSQEEEAFSLTAIANSKILVLGGEPIHEPVVGNGPFVMNSQKEIEQAWLDFKTGKMRLD